MDLLGATSASSCTAPLGILRLQCPFPPFQVTHGQRTRGSSSQGVPRTGRPERSWGLKQRRTAQPDRSGPGHEPPDHSGQHDPEPERVASTGQEHFHEWCVHAHWHYLRLLDLGSGGGEPLGWCSQSAADVETAPTWLESPSQKKWGRGKHPFVACLGFQVDLRVRCASACPLQWGEFQAMFGIAPHT